MIPRTGRLLIGFFRFLRGGGEDDLYLLHRQPIDLQRDLWGHRERLELLCLSRPEWVRGLHEAYLRAGADIIRTHTLEASPLSLAAAGLEQEAFYLNHVAAQLACEAVDAVRAELAYRIDAFATAINILIGLYLYEQTAAVANECA